MTGSKEDFQNMREAQMQEDYYESMVDLQGMVTMMPTKSNIESSANNLITAIKEGNGNPFEILARMEAVKSFCEAVRDGVNDFVRTELERYGKEGHKSLLAKFELAEVGTKYHFEKDVVWSALNSDMEKIKEKMKEQEKFLKALSKPLNEADMDSGEIKERIPPYKTSKSSFKITLAK